MRKNKPKPFKSYRFKIATDFLGGLIIIFACTEGQWVHPPLSPAPGAGPDTQEGADFPHQLGFALVDECSAVI